MTRIREVYQVSAPLAGYTARSPVEVGDPVTAFETVVAAIAPAAPAFLDARAREEAEAAVSEGEAALRAAEARVEQRVSDLDYATAQHDRSEALAGRGVIPQSSLDDAALRLRVAETALAAARSEREMAEATLARARAALIGPLSSDAAEAGDACCVEITAPASGHVLSIVNRSARLVQPGEPLLEIGEPGDLEIEVDLLSSDAVRIGPGAAAYVGALGRTAARSACPTHRSCRLHQGLGPRHRGTARPGLSRLRGPGRGPRPAGRQLPSICPHRRMARRGRAAGSDLVALPHRRRLDGISGRRRPRSTYARRDRPAQRRDCRGHGRSRRGRPHRHLSGRPSA